MFCYCFVSIFAAVLALTFFFHPPFSSHVLTDKCGLTETIPRARYCCLQQHCLVQFIRKQLDCWKGSMHTQYVSPHCPCSYSAKHCATSHCMGVAWLEIWGWNVDSQFPSSSSAFLQGWTRQTLLVPQAYRDGLQSFFRQILGTQASRNISGHRPVPTLPSRNTSGKRSLPTLQADVFIPVCVKCDGAGMKPLLYIGKHQG